MDLKEQRTEEVKYIKAHYSNNSIVIIGLNDAHGASIHESELYCGDLPEQLQRLFTINGKAPLTIDAFLTNFNTTEDLKLLLASNITVEELKILKGYCGIIGNKTFNHYNPKCLLSTKEGDSKIFLTSQLQTAKEPIVIYSSGIKDLMNALETTIEMINFDCLDQNFRKNYGIIHSRLADPNTLGEVMKNVEQNIIDLIKLNPQAVILLLGADRHHSIDNEISKMVGGLLEVYNSQLLMICEKHGVTFVDTMNIRRDQLYNKCDPQEKLLGYNIMGAIVDGVYNTLKGRTNQKRGITQENHYFYWNRDFANNGVFGIYNYYANGKDNFYRTYGRLLEGRFMSMTGQSSDLYNYNGMLNYWEVIIKRMYSNLPHEDQMLAEQMLTRNNEIKILSLTYQQASRKYDYQSDSAGNSD